MTLPAGSELKIHPIVLLTGAGFTHNFGGYLATQMWEHIFNEAGIYKSARLQALMRGKKHKFDFEKLYATLRKEGGTDFETYQKSVTKVYSDLDEIVRRSLDQSKHRVSLVGLRRWLGRRFSGLGERPKMKGFIFSLNQDLFFERQARDGFAFALPGLPPDAQPGAVQHTREIVPVRLPEQISAASIYSSLQDQNLIKLHGSCNWQSSNGGVMVLGEGKMDSILQEPLLKIYSDLFESVLSRPGLQLWAIGYGFGDPHINACIARSIRNHGLRLCIIDYSRPNDFFKRLEKAPAGTDLIDGVSAFIANSLLGVFPMDDWSESKPLAEMEAIMATLGQWKAL